MWEPEAVRLNTHAAFCEKKAYMGRPRTKPPKRPPMATQDTRKHVLLRQNLAVYSCPKGNTLLFLIYCVLSKKLHQNHLCDSSLRVFQAHYLFSVLKRLFSLFFYLFFYSGQHKHRERSRLLWHAYNDYVMNCYEKLVTFMLTGWNTKESLTHRLLQYLFIRYVVFFFGIAQSATLFCT